MHHLWAFTVNVSEILPNMSLYSRDRGQKQSPASVACCLLYLAKLHYETKLHFLLTKGKQKKLSMWNDSLSKNVCLATCMSQLWILYWLEHKRDVNAHSWLSFYLGCFSNFLHRSALIEMLSSSTKSFESIVQQQHWQRLLVSSAWRVTVVQIHDKTCYIRFNVFSVMLTCTNTPQVCLGKLVWGNPSLCDTLETW